MPDDRKEFLRWFLPTQPELRAFIGALVRDRHAREDVFQEVALALWRGFERFDRGRSFGAWARGVAANIILQHRARDARFPLAFRPEVIAAVVDAFDRTEPEASRRREALEECVKHLPERSRRILSMRYAEEQEIGQIARQTGRTADAIYQALSRIRGTLEECISRRLAAELSQ